MAREYVNERPLRRKLTADERAWKREVFERPFRDVVREMFALLRRKHNVVARINAGCCTQHVEEEMLMDRKLRRRSIVYLTGEDQKALNDCAPVRVHWLVVPEVPGHHDGAKERALVVKIIEIARSIGLTAQWSGRPGEPVVVSV